MLDLILAGSEVVSFAEPTFGGGGYVVAGYAKHQYGFGDANGAGAVGRILDHADGFGMSQGAGYGDGDGGGPGEGTGRSWAGSP